MRGSNWGPEKSDRPRRGRWGRAEIACLREMYGLWDDEVIAREVNRPVKSVRKMAETLFPEVTKPKGPWTEVETQHLRRYLGAAEPELVARILGRTTDEVQTQIVKLGQVCQSRRWTQEEIAQFKRLYGTRTNADLAVVFGRSVEDVEKEAELLCLGKDKSFLRKLKDRPPTRMPRWSAEEIAQLEQLYPQTSNLEIARKLGRSVKSVVSKAHILGFKKDLVRLEEMGRQNVSLRHRKRKGEAEGQ